MGFSILIVDDSKIQTKIIEKIVKPLDVLTFYIVNSAEEACQILKTEEIDILISDFNLNDKNTAMDIIKCAVVTNSYIHIYIMSTDIAPEAKAFPQLKGYLIKPLNLAKFPQLISKIVDKALLDYSKKHEAV